MENEPAASRLVSGCGWLLLAIGTFLRAFLTFNRELDPDEFQHLHSAWMVAHGFLVYRDFWEPHGPLLYYLLWPWLAIFPEGWSAVIATRFLLSASGFLILYLTYHVARQVIDRSKSIFAAGILSCSFLFLDKSIEIRPDQLLVICWLAALLIVIRPRGRSAASLVSAGAVLGIGFLFSPKALLAGAAMLPIILMLSRAQPQWLRRCAIQLLLFGLGVAMPIGIGFAVVSFAGAGPEMLRYLLIDNFTFPHDHPPIYLFHLRNVCFLALGICGMFIDHGPDRRHRALKISALLLLVMTFVTAYPFPQITLLYLPLFAIYCAVSVTALTRWFMERRTGFARRALELTLVLAAVSAAALIPLFIVITQQHPFGKTNVDQQRRMEYVLSITSASDRVFDGEEAYVFRPQAIFYGALVLGVQWRIRQGQIDLDLANKLRDRDTKVVIMDDRIAALSQSDLNVILSEYMPSAGDPQVLIPREPLKK